MTDISVTQVFKVRAWEKLRERKNNYSGAEKGRGSHHDASNWGSNPALFFPAPKKTGIRRLHINTVVAKNVSSWGSNPAL